MATPKSNRFSTYTTSSTGVDAKSEKKELWSSLLDSVASGRRLPEKNLLVLGGTVDSQREFVESLYFSRARATASTAVADPPVANSFALGYTYYDVLDDADHDEDTALARVSIHTLSTPAPAFAALLRPLLTPQSVPGTVIVVLLDWAEPWRWLRQLREWILLLRTVLVSTSDEVRETMEEVMTAWRDRGRGGGTNLDGTAVVAGSEAGAALPLGPGEWEDALGLPLCLVCQNAEKMEFLEKTQNWKEEDFDQVLQFLRTVLLRHGASLIYTTPSTPSQLPSLLHSSLGIHSLLKKQPLKPNVIDRDKIVVPPNWDSWGKIRVLREGFDVETVSSGWSIDLDQPFPAARRQTNGGEDTELVEANGDVNPEVDSEPDGSTVALYEQAVKDPRIDALQLAVRKDLSTSIEVRTDDLQEFLLEQQQRLEKHRQRADDKAKTDPPPPPKTRAVRDPSQSVKVEDHIGPVQFNMGGIQVDADDMLKRLMSMPPAESDEEDEEPQDEAPADPPSSDNLEAFFKGLMNRNK